MGCGKHKYTISKSTSLQVSKASFIAQYTFSLRPYCFITSLKQSGPAVVTKARYTASPSIPSSIHIKSLECNYGIKSFIISLVNLFCIA